VTMPPVRGAGTPLVTPTPNMPRALPTPRQDSDQYVVQPGDSLGVIATRYGVGVEALMQANGLVDANLLEVGQTLVIPAPDPGQVGSSFKIIPDSELVYGPASANFDIEAFVRSKGGYLASYTQDVDGETLTGAQVVEKVAQNYSVNPRLLLALLEFRSHWLTSSQPDQAMLDYPLGLVDPWHQGLYLQLTWASNQLNRGFYLWRANAVSTWVLSDGSVIPVDPTINAGTAGVQNLLAQQDDLESWKNDVDVFGLFQTYFFMFGTPFDLAIEPLLPATLTQPRLQLPFENGETWSFTGGPHGGWDTGSAWAALDFAPPGDAYGCVLSDEWVTAAADGWIVRTGNGAVIQDLDGDGYEQTGWVIFYMHIESRERVQPGTYLFAGQRVGHPSCEGGVSKGTHVHIARKYNGEWISADGSLPFVMDGWSSSGDGIEYDGFLKKNGKTVEAWDGRNELNQISR
jgi:LasA protease